LAQITEAAEKIAKDKLADKMSDDFDKILKEEINKITNKESVNESIVDEVKEPVNKGSVKKADVNKESLSEEVKKVDLRESTFENVEAAFESAQPDDSFGVEDEQPIDLSDIENELSKMEGMTNNVEASIQAENSAEETDPYLRVESLYTEMSEAMNDIKNIKMQKEMDEKFKNHMIESFGDTYEQDLGESVNQLKEMFMSRQKGEPFAPVNENEDAFEADADVNEMHDKVPHGATAPAETGHNTSPSGINEDEDAEVDERSEDEVVDETAGSSKGHAANRTVGNENMPTSSPRKDSTQRDFQRSNTNESVVMQKFAKQKEIWEKRLGSLLKENKSITKAYNAEKLSGERKVKFIGEAKEALSKYRNQLQEMAVFNTNLAYTNNILLDESIALTADDKKTIVSEFKNISSITESTEKYNSLVEGFKGTKKSMNENLEDKVNDTINPSSSRTIVEQVNEKTAYSNSHLDEIKKRIDYKRVK
jgi:hypothetical protein